MTALSSQEGVLIGDGDPLALGVKSPDQVNVGLNRESSVAIPTRSKALDDLIMGTNNSSIVSKRSVERLYYGNEAHFFRFFVHKFQRRAPLINRGYWLRLRAIDAIVRQFLQRPSKKHKVIINLGCGYDVLPWQCHTRYPEACKNALFIDVDYPDLMRRKRSVILETPELKELLGQDISLHHSQDDPVILKTDAYCQVACDLRELGNFRQTLEKVADIPESEVLFVAEVSITYMDTQSADALIEWARTMGQAEFCLLEQILPHGENHPFAQTMLAHFEKLKTPPRSVKQYRTTASQLSRFKDRGWEHAEVWDLWDAWKSDTFVDPAERASLDQIEPFDEWEEFLLFCRHYFVLHAQAVSNGCEAYNSSGAVTAARNNIETPLSLETFEGTKHTVRRFGNAMRLQDADGCRFSVTMMGGGVMGRSNTYDVYSLGHRAADLEMPLSGPAPRMCATMTDLGDYGVLLVGGRTSPSNAMSDCWIFQRGLHMCWKETKRLPVPLYRHAALRLQGTSLVLVAGGRCRSTQISDLYFIFHPTRGWTPCEVKGSRPLPTFGGALCQFTEMDQDNTRHRGLIFGGVNSHGLISTEVWQWEMDISGTKPHLIFQLVEDSTANFDHLHTFGAQTAYVGGTTYVCGGVGDNAIVLGQQVASVAKSANLHILQYQLEEKGESPLHDKLPFMIGCSVVSDSHGLTVFNGGATCFSMGTYWERNIHNFRFTRSTSNQVEISNLQTTVTFLKSGKVVNSPINGSLNAAPRTTVVPTAIPRIKLDSAENFDKILTQRSPVVLEGLTLGDCAQKWSPSHLITRVGQNKEVIIHECTRDTDKMDFQAKNFNYVAQSFGTFMEKAQAGARVYLRALSQAKPSEAPASLNADFPSLAVEFELPKELEFVREHIFSSVLRISGKVNMWLHYDVMANVYAQVRGAKRMVLFPPSDVTQLYFGPGTSSSSLDVFTALSEGILAGVHPFEAELHPGDILFIPPMWAHTAEPKTDWSVAVNVFFRDLGTGYAPGRDVYGNRDLAVYEKGRLDVAKMGKTFQHLPLDVRQFYLLRLAEELKQMTEAG